MKPRKAAAGKMPRATDATRKKPTAASDTAKQPADDDASKEWFVGPYGDLISREEYLALMKRAGEAPEGE